MTISTPVTRRANGTHRQATPAVDPKVDVALGYPDYIYGLHEAGGEQLMVNAGRKGWVLALAAIGLDGGNTPADFAPLAAQQLGVIVRINHGYGTQGTLPLPQYYGEFAAACGRYVARSRGARRWIIGNEPNHENERPQGAFILPGQYADAYLRCRHAIHAVPGHDQDQVLVAAPAPWNATTTYAGNEKGDWIRYFIDVMSFLPDDACDGFALHTYTHDLDPRQITGDFFQQQPGYRHLRSEFKTYRDYMNAIPDRFRHLPVYITETDPTRVGVGWNPSLNVGWVRAAYHEIASWNRERRHQPIQSLILYRWPLVPDQPEWSISNRPKIIEDFQQAMGLAPAEEYALPLPRKPEPLVVHEPGNLLPEDKRWNGIVYSSLGLNLRTGPSTQHEVIQILPPETLVTVLAELNDWIYVSTLGKLGYVSRAFILPHADQDADDPLDPADFLRSREDLLNAPLSPPQNQHLSVDPEQGSWTEHAVTNAWNNYGALIEQLAGILEVDPAVAVAVMAVESGGAAFDGDGDMIIRFEPHIFFEEWGRMDPERFANHFRFDLNRPWEGHQWRPQADQEWRDFHGNNESEWQVFTLARTRFDDAAAKGSISMGVPQIMGFNHRVIGYGSVQEMFAAFSKSANSQVIGFFDFVRSNPGQLEALRQKDFLTFATGYNGSGQAALYAGLMEDAERTYRRLREAQQGASDDASTRLPLPLPPGGNPALDPAIYAAWRNHILQGFANNQTMFDRLLKAFIEPYYMTVRMYQALFVLGIAAFVLAAALSFYSQQAIFALIFGGLSLGAFVTYFVGRPLRALEENLNFITWLGVIYNSYWARLVFALDRETVQEDMAAITEDFVQQIERLLDKSDALNQRRPNL